MLLGTHSPKLDDKGRVILPAKFREDLGGGIVVETLFNVPGLGYELTRAVANRDVPLVKGLALVLGAVVLTILLAGDVLTRVQQQRPRRQEHS